MSSVSSSVELRLDKEERELLEKAIAKIKDITEDVINENSELFLDEEGVFSNLLYLTRRYDGKLPTVFEIYE